MSDLRRWVLAACFVLEVISQVRGQEEQNERHQGNSHYGNSEARWDHWTNWTPCSSDCGAGISFRSRDCRSMEDGSHTQGCIGVEKQAKLCTVEDCIAAEGENARSCSKLNVRVYGGRRYRWQPYRHPSNKCQMACRPVGHGFYLGLQKNVTDGTPCSDNEGQVCVGGECKTYGCDKIIDSTAVEDRCGICNGDGKGCKQVDKTFSDSTKYGYTTIATIPAGATHINITELTESRNYLAIRATDGSFRMNTDFKLSRFGQHSGAGTSFKYSRRDGPWCPGECIQADGPTNVDLEIVILFYTDNPGIKYTYNMPHRHHTDHDVTTDDVIEEGEDNFVRTNGNKRPIFSHDFKFKKRHGHHRNKSTSETDNNSPVITESRDNPPETNSTETIDDVSSDDTSDEEAETPNEIREPEIVEDTFTGVYIDEAGEDEDKDRAPLETRDPVERKKVEATPTDAPEAPSNREEDMYTNDNRERALYSWRISGYTECSATCGEGKQSPILQCIVTDKNTAVMHKYCEDITKPSIQVLACNYGECVPSWQPTKWTKCSVTCGQGTQSRDYVCTRSDDVQLSDYDCNTPKPTREEQSCDLGSCASGWFFTEWDEKCSEGCGNGVQTRKVHCVTGSRNSIHSCPERERPDAERQCRSDNSCSGSWFTGPWSECNATCGMAYQTRSVLCVWRHHGNTMRVVHDHRCTGEEKPPAYMSCDLQPCTPQWYMSDWGSCSASCGHGSRTRDVRCMDDNKRASSECNPDDKPILEERCHNRACPPRDQNRDPPTEIDDKECGDSFPQCTLVLQARLCHYKYYKKICCSSCSKMK